MPQQNFDFHKVGTVNIFSEGHRPEQSKNDVVNFRMEPQDSVSLQDFLFKNDLNKSDFIRFAIRKAIERHSYEEQIETLLSWIKR